MNYYKNTEGVYIASISTGIGAEQITESEYGHILSVIKECPLNPPDGCIYKLRVDTLEWELAEMPTAPDEQKPEDEEVTVEEIATAIEEALA